MLFKKLDKKTKVKLVIQGVGLLAGTSTHLFWIINNGFSSEKYNAPFVTKVFWDSLTFLDPIAAVLLISKPKTGMWLTAIIIVVDVIHNSVYCFRDFPMDPFALPYWMKNNWMLMCQLAFGVFVVTTFKSNMREIKLKNNELKY